MIVKKISKKFIFLSLISMAITISGCNSEKEVNNQTTNGTSGENQIDSGLKLFGVGATEGIVPWIQSENDSWKTVQIDENQASLVDINGVLINNNGQSDTADIQITGNGTTSHMFMLKSESGMDLSSYKTGFIEFKVRAKTNVPSTITVSVDNEWPNRSSLVLANALKGGGEWETLTVPVTCLKPFDGATAVDFSQVGAPFHLDIKESFDFEITDIIYRSTTDRETVIDADSCGVSNETVNNAPALDSGEAALYYSGDINKAEDYSSDYPLGQFGFAVTEENQIVSIVSTGNGGVFLGNDDSDRDLSSYKDDFITLDMKVKSYGDSDGIQIRMDGVSVEYSTFFSVNSSILPSDDTWYRCQIPVSSIIPEANLSQIKKAIFISGQWDSMNNLEFAFANVSIKGEGDSYDASAPCTKL